jgi:signal transduction histidine kinase
MPKYLHAIIHLTILTMFSGCSLLDPEYLPYTFEATYTKTITDRTRVGFYDFDHDGRFEMWDIGVSDSPDKLPHAFLLFDENFASFLWQNNDPMRYFAVLPISSTAGEPGYKIPSDILVAARGVLDVDYIIYRYIDGSIIARHTIYSGIDFNKDGNWDGNLIPVKAVDLNNDGRDEVLALGFAGFDLQPRGVWAIDVFKGDTFWTYPTGCSIPKMFLTDLDRDGNSEIALSTSAPGNGSVAGNTDDHHSYLIILDARTGTPIIEEEMSAGYSSCFTDLADLKDEGTFLVSGVSTSSAGGDFGRISIWKGLPLELVNSFDVPGYFNNMATHDVDGDGKDEVVTSSIEGSISGYDHNGFLKAEFQFGKSLGYMKSIAGLIPIKESVLLVELQELNEVIGLGENFKPLFKLSDAQVGSIRMLESPRIAIVTSSAIGFGQFVRTPIAIPYREIAIFGSGVFIVAMLFALFSFFRLPMSWRTLDQNFKCGIIWLNKKGEVKRMNKGAKDILPDIQQRIPPEIIRTIENLRAEKKIIKDVNFTRGMHQSERLINAHIRLYRHGVLVTLDDATDMQRSKFLRTWAEGVGRIVHFFKSPAAAIQLSIEQLKKGNNFNDTILLMEGQSKLLIDSSQRFKKVFTLLDLQTEPLEMNKLIRRILVPVMGLHSNRIKFDLISEDEQLIINGDRDQIEILMRCLLDNALEALGNAGHIQIRLHKSETIQGRGEEWIHQFVEVELNDNGPGMDAQKIEQALKPGFSTKKQGMGLGLPQAKLITELHGGEFDIRGQLGAGVSIHLKFPLSES